MTNIDDRTEHIVSGNRVSRIAAVGFALVWIADAIVLNVPIPTQNTSPTGLLGLQVSPADSILHFALIDAVAPILLCVAAAPTVRRFKSVDATFTVTLSGVSAWVVSTIQLGVGTWLITSGSDQPLAEAAAVQTLRELDGVKAALIAVAIATLAHQNHLQASRPTPRDGLVIATAIGLGITALAFFTSSAELQQSTWVSVPLLVIAAYMNTAGVPPRPPPSDEVVDY